MYRTKYVVPFAAQYSHRYVSYGNCLTLMLADLFTAIHAVHVPPVAPVLGLHSAVCAPSIHDA